MIAGEQDVRNLPTPKIERPSILRILQQPGRKRFVQSGSSLAEDARDPPSYRVDNHCRRGSTIGYHVVTDGELIVYQMLTNSMIDSLVVTTNQNKMFLPAQFPSNLLSEPSSAGRH